MYTVITYNIRNGLGANPANDSCQTAPRNRLEQLISFIEAMDPDILGIQEASHWGDNELGCAREVAQRLGMSYFLAEAGFGGHHVALFTKFEILEAHNYAREESHLLRVKLQPPWGVSINVFVTHLPPCWVSAVLDTLGPERLG